MKRKLSWVICAVLCIGLLSACGGKENPYPDIDPMAFIANDVISMSEEKALLFTHDWKTNDDKSLFYKDVTFMGWDADAIVFIEDGKVSTASYSINAGENGKDWEAFKTYNSNIFSALLDTFGNPDSGGEVNTGEPLNYTWLENDAHPTIVLSTNVSSDDDENSIFLSYMKLD